jgi:hypothetical protein
VILAVFLENQPVLITFSTCWRNVERCTGDFLCTDSNAVDMKPANTEWRNTEVLSLLSGRWDNIILYQLRIVTHSQSFSIEVSVVGYTFINVNIIIFSLHYMLRLRNWIVVNMKLTASAGWTVSGSRYKRDSCINKVLFIWSFWDDGEVNRHV